MIQGISSTDERFLTSLAKTDERLATAQNQITSGRRMNKASDQPDQIGAALMARANLEQTRQIGLNLGRAKTEVDTAEQSLQIVVSLLDRLNTLGVQGSSETMPASQREQIAVEVASIIDQLVNVSNTSVEGRYVFGGDSDQTSPYTLIPPDATSDSTVSSYNGTPSTREVMHPNGTRFPIAHSAEEIFDASGASIFQAAIALRDALKNVPTAPPDDPAYLPQYQAQTAEIDAAVTAVKTSRSHVSEELAFYGVAQNRITEATNFSNTLALRQQQELASVRDADIAQAAIELTQAQIQRQTSLQARAKMTPTSLFDYLR